MEREKVVAALAAELNIDRASAGRICTAFAGAMAGGLGARDRFRLKGLGTFERNKNSDGSEVIFRASSGLRRMVQAAIDVRSEQLQKQAASRTVVVACEPVMKANISGAPFNVPAVSGLPSGTPAPCQQESGAKQAAPINDPPAPASMPQDPERCEMAATSRTIVPPEPAEAKLQPVLAAANNRGETTIAAEPGLKRPEPEQKPLPIGVQPGIPPVPGNQWPPAVTSSAAPEGVPEDLPSEPGTPVTAAPQEKEKGEAGEPEEDGEILRLIKELAEELAESGATPYQVRLLERFAGGKLRLLDCLRFIYGAGYRFTTFDLLACWVADECRIAHSRFRRTESRK